MKKQLRCARWFVACLAMSVLTGCVTTQERPDGSTLVRFAPAEALGLRAPGTGTDPRATSQQAQPATAPKQTQPASAAAAPSAPSIATTALAGLFTKHPYDGTPKTYYPRVALTITDWARSDCWTARAKIWWSVKKSEDVAPFSVCFNKQSLGFALNSAAGMHIFFEQMSVEQSGNVRTEGPKPPMIAVPDNHPFNIDRQQATFSPFVQQLIAETGWKGGAPTNFWIVGYKAQPAVVQQSSGAPIADDWSRVMPILRAAIECQGPVPPIKSLQPVFKTVNGALTGEHVLPEPLTVFGSLKVSRVEIFQGTDDEGTSYTVKPEGVKLAEVVKAAHLKKDHSRYVRVAKDGLVELTEVQPGVLQLACIRNSVGK